MPIKKDALGKRWVEMELIVVGTPEQVWHAMATGPGNAAWFTKGEIEPRVGGKFVLDFGGGVTTAGEVTTWEPPHQFSYVERDWDKGAPPVATEITIASRAGGRCVVRMVHSLFTSSDAWDDQIEGFERGWPGFFVLLGIYLEHFAGASAATFMVVSPTTGDSLSTWCRLSEALGVVGANSGEQRTSSSAPESWTGVVEHIHQDARQRYVIVRVETPSPGSVLVGTYEKGGGTNVTVCRYFYGENAMRFAADGEPRWRQWLNTTFGSGQ